MLDHCLSLLNENSNELVIEKLELVKSKNQDSFHQLITMNDYQLFNRAMQLGSKSVITYILSSYGDHQALVSSKDFTIFSTLTEDKRYDILNIIFRHINLDCRNMLFAKFGEFQMSLWCVQAGYIKFYREAQHFSYFEFLEIIKAAITGGNTKTYLSWLTLNFGRHTWAETDLLDCLRIAIRVGNFEAVKLIETKKNDICCELLLPEHSFAFVEAGRHQNLFSYLLNRLSNYTDQLEHIFMANEYAWLHEVVKISNRSDILSMVLGIFQDPTSRTLAITSRDNALYDFAYLKENSDLMEVLLAEKTIFDYALTHYKCPKYEDTLPPTSHLKHLLLESHICLGHGEISKANITSLLSFLNLEQKCNYFKLALEHKHSLVLHELYSSIQTDASQILFSEIKKEIAESRSLPLIKFLMEWREQTVLDILGCDLPAFFNHSISKNRTDLLRFLNQKFPEQFKDFFKDLTHWQEVVSHFSLDVFELLFTIMGAENIEPVLKQNNYTLFFSILEKGLATKNQFGNLTMLNKIMDKFPHLRLEMVTSKHCVSAALKAEDPVAVRTLLYLDNTIFFAVIQQLFQSHKIDEVKLLLGLIQSDRHHYSELNSKNPKLLDPQYHDEYREICKNSSRKRLRDVDGQLEPTSARP